MRGLALALLVSLLIVLLGCGAEGIQSHLSAEDCYLCGGGIEKIVPDYWGQNNIALISLNTFEIILCPVWVAI